jgi:peptide-methionine (R)-S-oxide reductase
MANEKIVKSEEHWKKELSPEEYEIIRKKGTEPAFSGEYVNEHSKGMYTCRACGAELFSSDNKYDSGSGWPSFDRAVKEGAVKTAIDESHGMRRVEITCSACGAHLGHVFDDGPKETTGQRFCVNSMSLKLKK